MTDIAEDECAWEEEEDPAEEDWAAHVAHVPDDEVSETEELDGPLFQ